MREFIKKYKLYIIIGVFALVLFIGTTIAWYAWESDTNALVKLDVCTPVVNVVGGSTINGTDMIPVLNKEEGLVKEITVNLNNKCNSDVDMNLYLLLDSLPVELQDETFVYELYRENTQIKVGNFADNQQGSTIQLVKNYKLTESSTSYKLYIYIDGTKDNSAEMANKTFKFSLMASGNNAIFEKNVINSNTATGSYQTNFLNINNLARNSIKTINFIDITDDTTVPNDAIDISSLNDESIMLWYATSPDDSSLKNITIGSTSGIIKLNSVADYMFYGLTNLESINNLYRLDTSDVTSMIGMFNNCQKLKNLDLSNFNTSKVISMRTMFQNGRELEKLDLSSFDTKNVKDMAAMFANCFKLEQINLLNFNTAKVETMTAMFGGCIDLKSLDLSGFDVSNVSNMVQMFNGCTNLESIKFGTEFKTSKVSSMVQMFNNCSSLTSLDLEAFDTNNVTAMNNMFNGCTNLESIKFGENFKANKAVNMSFMFNECSSLISLDLRNFNTLNVTNMQRMFKGCSKLTEVKFGDNFNTTKVTTMQRLFDNCNNLTSLDLSGFNTSNVTEMDYMFLNCYNLSTIFVSEKWNVNNVTTSTGMFQSCEKLNSFDNTKTDVTMANYTTGYLTNKNNS